jgi:hypothetical protein
LSTAHRPSKCVVTGLAVLSFLVGQKANPERIFQNFFQLARFDIAKVKVNVYEIEIHDSVIINGNDAACGDSKKHFGLKGNAGQRSG